MRLTKSRRPADRDGATIVEFAITAPILFMIFFAGIEFSRANMLLHTATIAATEGARRGIVSGATVEDCRAAALAEMQAIGASSVEIDVKPAVITDDTQMITVGVMAPVDLQNGYFTPRFFLGEKVIRVVSITREAKETEGSEDAARAANTEVAGRLEQTAENSAGQ